MAVCTIARARAVIGGPIFGVRRTASSSASFQRKTMLVSSGAADAAFDSTPGATHSSRPALVIDLRKVRRLSREWAMVEASRSLLFTVTLSLLITGHSSLQCDNPATP